MSALPEWLWPLEDEEAVQEAERLIEETHNTLKRMEADMQVQRFSCQHLSEQTEKLKSVVNNKINVLEKELKTFSEPKRSYVNQNQQHTSDECHTLKLMSKFSESVRNQQHATNSHPKICSKANAAFGSQLQTQTSFSGPSLSKKGKNVVSQLNTSTAEKVVLTARAKVQDALTVARNVSASLNQHMSASSHHSKAGSCSKVNNIGIFEVKSQADEKRAQAPKKRLGQTSLPSISIKCGLEKQAIPSFQVTPGEKLVAANVSVFNMKFDDEVNSKQSVGAGTKDQNFTENLKFAPVAHQTIHPPSSTSTGLEGAFAQLSKQLAEVEELREVNQAQVNHVLRFLLSRVCVSTPEPKRSNISPVSKDETNEMQSKEVPTTPQSTTQSESSQCPIVYDSLSRFLETYKRAAEQSMLAQKRAVVRRQKFAVQQKKEIHRVQNSTDNHLLIGPLRHAAELKEADTQQAMSKVGHSMESLSISSSAHQEVNPSVNEGSGTNSVSEMSSYSGNVLAKKQKSNSSLENSESSMDDSPVLSALKPPRAASGEEYEDDWEEEESPIGSPRPDKGKGNSESFLRPIIETEENLSSLYEYENKKSMLQQDSPKSLEVKIEPLNTNFIMGSAIAAHSEEKICETQAVQIIVYPDVSETVPLNKNCQGDLLSQSGRKDQVEDLLSQSGRKDQVEDAENLNDSGKLNAQDELYNHGADLSQSRNDENLEEQIHKRNYDMTAHDKPLQKENQQKQHQIFKRRSKARLVNLHSSSSDAEMNSDLRPPRKSKHWDLNLREDLQLQSAILLNWQLEDRLKSKSNETSAVKSQASVAHAQMCDITADIQHHWQRTFDQLDQRLKSMEENERIHRIASEIRLQSRQEPSNVINEGAKNVASSFNTDDKGSHLNIPTKDQMVQTSPEKCKVPIASKNFGHYPVSSKEQQNQQHVKDYKAVNGSAPPKPFLYNDDLTAELLAYSRMAIVPRVDFREQLCSRSSSSSTTSSHLQPSSNMASMSDGELRDSANRSCSCSEGEFCICGGHKLCSERAPPDGSQTLSDGENFIKDVSQGEIPLSEARHLLKDTSYGEIAHLLSTGVPVGDEHNEEESMDSDGMEWELR